MKFEELDFDQIKKEIELENKLMFHKTNEDLDVEHAKECIKNNVYVALVNFKDTWFFEFYDPDMPGFIYDFPLDRCDSELEALIWINHMTEKGWVTRLHIKQFVEIYLKKKGILK